MSHLLIVGITKSGKSTFAFERARQRRAAGRKILVLDPNLDQRWPATLVTADVRKFVAYAFANRDCDLIIDEGRETVGKSGVVDGIDMVTVGTRFRHFGHHLTLIGHRAAMLNKDLREQCDDVVAFRQHGDDCRTLCKQYGSDAFMACLTLEQGEFIARIGWTPKPVKSKLILPR